MNRYTTTFKDIVCGMEVSSDDISLLIIRAVIMFFVQISV